MSFYDLEKAYLNCKIDGNWFDFDAQSGGDIETSHTFYRSTCFKFYLGSATEWYCNGVRQTSTDIRHFYIKSEISNY